VLWFERRVVDALTDPSLPPAARADVAAYVEETLRSMPEHLRLGVAGESVLFGTLPWLQAKAGRLGPDAIERRLERWSTSGFDPLRQYVRLLHSLVLFAENELGCVKPEARADLLLVDGNPLENLDLLAANGAHLSMVMHRGVPKRLSV